jgi:methyl-accepting chemotaxis protein
MQVPVMTHASELRDRIKFSQIDDLTKSALSDYYQDIQQLLPGILEEFYVHISQWPNLKEMFRDESRIAHAKSAQAVHWLKLFTAEFDDDYAESVRRIGLVHSRIGLEPSWYIGAYSFTLSRLYANASHKYKSLFSPKKAQEKTANLMRAINQCVMVDMDMAISIYLEENTKTYNKKLNNLADVFEQKIGTVVEAITISSANLESNAGSLASAAALTSSNSTLVAAAAEEASTNVQTVSSATEEMSASINEIAHLTHNTTDASTRAVEETGKTAQIVDDLKQSITLINDITSLISGIAEQTNLLALNATIEAARAGETGKGFAVVASEVKALATQTGQATENIRRQVDEIIQKSDTTYELISHTKETITEVNMLVESMTESMQQQQIAVSEIARNVAEASTGTQEITRNITEISQVAGETDHVANSVLDSIKELTQQNEDLSIAVREFLDELKSE